jgi:hypothetical protein
MREGTEVPAYLKDYIAPPASVAAGRSPQGNILFPPEGDAAIPAVSRANLNQRFIGKFLHCALRAFGTLPYNRSQFPASAFGKTHLPVHQGKEGIISPAAYICSGMYFCSSLPYDNGSGLYTAAAGRLNAQILGI